MHTPAHYRDLARACDDGRVLHRLARCPYPFVWHELAANPNTPPAALLELAAARHSPWNDNRLLHLLAGHPAADRTVLHAVLDATAAKLTQGRRPYAAAAALAGRSELEADEVRRLGALPGASARLRTLLHRRLAARGETPPPAPAQASPGP
ncbi:hypothetical protein [Kitasatospora sp. NPDC057936]|uniref:hypothetical protein n=1 Tax=Kitasatospora sp. NPDC057936 TaxID=3346283 RepID=UPI0036DEBF54